MALLSGTPPGRAPLAGAPTPSGVMVPGDRGLDVPGSARRRWMGWPRVDLAVARRERSRAGGRATSHARRLGGWIGPPAAQAARCWCRGRRDGRSCEEVGVAPEEPPPNEVGVRLGAERHRTTSGACPSAGTRGAAIHRGSGRRSWHVDSAPGLSGAGARRRAARAQGSCSEEGLVARLAWRRPPVRSA